MSVRPLGSDPSMWVEVMEPTKVERRFIVIAEDNERSSLANESQAFVWVRPISDDVAKTNDAINALVVYDPKSCPEGLNVRVDIGDNGNAHGC
jgi:hypothetical protein